MTAIVVVLFGVFVAALAYLVGYGDGCRDGGALYLRRRLEEHSRQIGRRLDEQQQRYRRQPR